MSAKEPELRDVLHHRQRSTEPRRRWTCIEHFVKFGCWVYESCKPSCLFRQLSKEGKLEGHSVECIPPPPTLTFDLPKFNNFVCPLWPRVRLTMFGDNRTWIGARKLFTNIYDRRWWKHNLPAHSVGEIIRQNTTSMFTITPYGKSCPHKNFMGWSRREFVAFSLHCDPAVCMGIFVQVEILGLIPKKILGKILSLL